MKRKLIICPCCSTLIWNTGETVDYGGGEE